MSYDNSKIEKKLANILQKTRGIFHLDKISKTLSD